MQCTVTWSISLHAEMSPDWNLSRNRELFGRILRYFWPKQKSSVLFLKVQELFGNFFGYFWPIGRNSVLFLGSFSIFWQHPEAFGGVFDQFWKWHRNSMLFSVLFSKNSRILEISWNLGASDTSGDMWLVTFVMWNAIYDTCQDVGGWGVNWISRLHRILSPLP